MFTFYLSRALHLQIDVYIATASFLLNINMIGICILICVSLLTSVFHCLHISWDVNIYKYIHRYALSSKRVLRKLTRCFP